MAIESMNEDDSGLDPERFRDLGKEVGELVTKKNLAYGDSVRNSGKIMQILYPNGISFDRIPAALVTVRILDKLSRIANDPSFGGEDPAQDISGYGLLLMDLFKNPEQTDILGMED